MVDDNSSRTFTKNELQWSSVSIAEVVETSTRFDASVYGAEGKRVRSLLNTLPWPLKPLNGAGGIAEIFHRPRFKRIFMNYSQLPIFQPSQITDLKPTPHLYISDKTDTNVEALKVKKGQILLTCSGTVGITTYVSNSYDGCVFSHDLLRIDVKDNEDAGYIYTFLKSEIGRALIQTNNYGAVIQHIEPEHLERVYIPYPDKEIRLEIGAAIERSFALRDEANDLIDSATHMLVSSLNLPPISDFLQTDNEIDAHSVAVHGLQNRFEASYHHTMISSINEHLSKYARELVRLDDSRISEKIFIPGRFKRVYVEKDYGVVFFGGKQIYELDPSGKKYLSLLHHGDRIKEQLTLKENTILVTCSGTIGKVQFTPKHWEGWAANQHVLRVTAKSDEVAGYVYIWLQSPYGEALIKRNIYGAVVDELDANQMASVPIPLLEDSRTQNEINSLALRANQLRYQAYELEQKAIRVFNDRVISHLKT